MAHHLVTAQFRSTSQATAENWALIERAETLFHPDYPTKPFDAFAPIVRRFFLPPIPVARSAT